MSYSYIEKKRIRKSFQRHSNAMLQPYMLEGQFDSYIQFLQADIAPEKRNPRVGLEAIMRSIFPIKNRSGGAALEYGSYVLEEPKHTVEECRLWGTTYASGLRAKVRLVFYKSGSGKNRTPEEVFEDNVFLGDIPRMTEQGSFLINGTERVVVSQLRRSPGVIVESDQGRTNSQGKLIYSARIVPNRGAWLDFEFDVKDLLYIRIDRKRKIPATVMLRALGYSTRAILEFFYEANQYKMKREKFVLKLVPERLLGLAMKTAIKDKSGAELVKAGQRITRGQIRKMEQSGIKELTVDDDYLEGERLAEDLVNPDTGELVADTNDDITPEIMEKVRQMGLKELKTLAINDVTCGPFVSDTLKADECDARDRALVEIYRVMRPGEMTTPAQAEQFFQNNLFFNPNIYDLSPVGRLKMDLRLGRKSVGESHVLEPMDIVDVMRLLVDVRNGKGSIDDIDHLSNRRVRRVGEMLADQYRLGLTRVEKVVAERLSSPDARTKKLTPQHLVNSRPINAAIKEFFNGNQLSQFMDQNNPLSEVAHKRRLSAMGVGGLTRERAGYGVRDVHPTHYGRLCPIETPEGPNIGLTSSMACYAQINEYGFICTPYRRIVDGATTDEVVYLSPMEGSAAVIAQATATVDAKGQLTEEQVPVRIGFEFGLRPPKEVEYMDVSAQQIISVAAALIPFIEHNDANRALMGSNMQRQAIPTLMPEKPLVGTGIERQVARDSRVCVLAGRAGTVHQVDASRIVIRTDEGGGGSNKSEVDIYKLRKYQRSNQDTCNNQRPIVKIGDKVEQGDILADGSSVDRGELALGRNVNIAFMPWNGYNFEDSIVISEQVSRDDLFTSMHIKQLKCSARETRLGAEEITADIPSVSEAQLSHLDETGIVRIGAEVKASDILVGRVTPKGETHLTPEEKLLRTVFGDKASNVKDTSLRVPHGADGTVIDVQILTRPGEEKDERALEIEGAQLAQMDKDLQAELDIVWAATCDAVRKKLLGQIVVKAWGHKAGDKITAKSLKTVPEKDWLKISVKEDKVNSYLTQTRRYFRKYDDDLRKQYDSRKQKLQDGEPLKPSEIKTVKVFLAIRRRLQIGDKMAGRHGNKGVISTIVPVEDMPYMEDGRPVDIVLNPLGIVSRMNIGQVFEVHLGWALKKIGEQISDMLDKGIKAPELRKELQAIYDFATIQVEELDTLSDDEIYELAENLRGGLPIATPAFDGVSEEQVKQLLEKVGLPRDGRVTLYDGRTGEAFDHPVTVGYMYMLKLNHLVEDKMHARSTGSYSLVTQQPLGGKAQQGGQRFGEMEVWALKAYGAAHTLREMLTVKSDDMQGRASIYRNIISGNYRMESAIPESFHVLMSEMKALGINFELET